MRRDGLLGSIHPDVGAAISALSAEARAGRAHVGLLVVGATVRVFGETPREGELGRALERHLRLADGAPTGSLVPFVVAGDRVLVGHDVTPGRPGAPDA